MNIIYAVSLLVAGFIIGTGLFWLAVWLRDKINPKL